MFMPEDDDLDKTPTKLLKIDDLSFRNEEEEEKKETKRP